MSDSHLTDDEVEALIAKAVKAERARCRQLIKTRSLMVRRDAARLRAKGTFTARSLWPPFKKRTCVMPKWETRARDMDAVADAFDGVQRGVELGWDIRKVGVNEHLRIHPAPVTDDEMRDALRMAHGLEPR